MKVEQGRLQAYKSAIEYVKKIELTHHRYGCPAAGEEFFFSAR